MKKLISMLWVPLTLLLILTACSNAPVSVPEGSQSSDSIKNSDSQVAAPDSAIKGMKPDGNNGADAALPDSLSASLNGMLDSYYVGQQDPAFEYFQHSSIQKFLAMWVKEETTDIEKPVWNLDSFTKIQIIDHELTVSRSDEQLYCCTFSDGAGRYGYAIVKYDEAGPSLGNWSITETTPYSYDFKANIKEISAALIKTDLDFPTAKASRTYLFDRKNKRADQIILFSDGKGDHYICYLGDPSFEIKKWYR